MRGSSSQCEYVTRIPPLPPCAPGTTLSCADWPGPQGIVDGWPLHTVGGRRSRRRPIQGRVSPTCSHMSCVLCVWMSRSLAAWSCTGRRRGLLPPTVCGCHPSTVPCGPGQSAQLRVVSGAHGGTGGHASGRLALTATASHDQVFVTD